MRKLMNTLKVVALGSALALAVVGMFPRTASAALAANRDCDATDNTCFYRVGDDGTITQYDLGNLLQ